jgi:hypothetical protein
MKFLIYAAAIIPMAALSMLASAYCVGISTAAINYESNGHAALWTAFLTLSAIIFYIQFFVLQKILSEIKKRSAIKQK